MINTLMTLAAATISVQNPQMPSTAPVEPSPLEQCLIDSIAEDGEGLRIILSRDPDGHATIMATGSEQVQGFQVTASTAVYMSDGNITGTRSSMFLPYGVTGSILENNGDVSASFKGVAGEDRGMLASLVASMHIKLGEVVADCRDEFPVKPKGHALAN